MLNILLRLLLSYLLGSVSGAMVMGKIKGVDIRASGSGNAGGTNAFRTQGVVFGLLVLLIDVIKGALAVGWVSGTGGEPGWLAIGCGVACVLGHVYPVFFGFKGGKGAGTLIGVLAVLSPAAILAVLPVWVVVLIVTGYVGLSTILAGVTYPVIVWCYLPDVGLPLGYFSLAMAAFLLFTHRSNVVRMWQGNENRFEKARLFHRVWLKWRA